MTVNDFLAVTSFATLTTLRGIDILTAKLASRHRKNCVSSYFINSSFYARTARPAKQASRRAASVSKSSMPAMKFTWSWHTSST